MRTSNLSVLAGACLLLTSSVAFAETRCPEEKDADNGGSVEVLRRLAYDHSIKDCNKGGRYVVYVTNADICEDEPIVARTFFLRMGRIGEVSTSTQVWCGKKLLGYYRNAVLQQSFYDMNLKSVVGYFQRVAGQTMFFEPVVEPTKFAGR